LDKFRFPFEVKELVCKLNCTLISQVKYTDTVFAGSMSHFGRPILFLFATLRRINNILDTDWS
jgi:hypothetical protein